MILLKEAWVFGGAWGRFSEEIKTRVRREQGENSTVRFTWDEVHRQNMVLGIPLPFECSALLCTCKFLAGCLADSFPASGRSLSALASTQQGKGLHPRLAPAF